MDPLRYKPFIAKLEAAAAEGRQGHVQRNLPRVREIVLKLDARLAELVDLRMRAGAILAGPA